MLENLNDVERFINEELEGWTYNRGKSSEIGHSPNNEVIQLFSPHDSETPFAEFWEGYYDIDLTSYTGLYGFGGLSGGACCKGSLDFAMDAVKLEHQRITLAPQIYNAVTEALDNDKAVNISYIIGNDNIRSLENGHLYAIDCECFKCGDKNKRCVVSVRKNENKWEVSYSIQKLNDRDFYEVEYSNKVLVG